MASTKAKTGPKPRAEAASNCNVNVRFSPQEYSALKAASKDLNTTMSDLVRITLFTAAGIVYKNKKEAEFLKVLKRSK